MKKIITSFLVFFMAITLTSNINASIDQKNIKSSIEKVIKQNNGVSKITKNAIDDDEFDFTPITSKTTNAVKKAINGDNEYMWVLTKGSTTAQSFYKKINNKIVNYKYEMIEIEKNYKYILTFNFRYNTNNKSNCSTQELGFGCVNMVQGEPVTTTTIANGFSNNKLTDKVIVYFDTKGNFINMISYSYYSNGKISEIFNYSIKKSSYYLYNKKGLMTIKRIYNSNGNNISSDTRSYHSNNKLKSRYYMNYTNKGKKTHGRYYTYRSNGKLSLQKRIAHNKKGYPTKMYSYVYNKQGKLRSNKYGKANRYTTYYKTNSTKISKVLNASYNSKGKLGKSKVVKATKISKYFPIARKVNLV